MLEGTSCHFSTGLYNIRLYQLVGFESRFLGCVFHSIRSRFTNFWHGSLPFLQVGGLLGGLVVKGALNLQQANALVIKAAAAKASRGHMAMSQTGHRRHIMRGAITVLAEHFSPAELQQQLKAAGLQAQYRPAKVSPTSSWCMIVGWFW